MIGKNEEEAKKTLSDLGFTVNISYEEDSSKDNGIVLKQSIEAGKEVEVETAITLTVNKLSETKSATVTIYLGSILKDRIQYEEVETETTKTETKEQDNNTTEKTTTKVPKKVNVSLKVGDDPYITNESYDPTTTIVKTIYGTGTVKLTLTINGNVEKKLDVNLNNTSQVTLN